MKKLLPTLVLSLLSAVSYNAFAITHTTVSSSVDKFGVKETVATTTEQPASVNNGYNVPSFKSVNHTLNAQPFDKSQYTIRVQVYEDQKLIQQTQAVGYTGSPFSMQSLTSQPYTASLNMIPRPDDKLTNETNTDTKNKYIAQKGEVNSGFRFSGNVRALENGELLLDFNESISFVNMTHSCVDAENCIDLPSTKTNQVSERVKLKTGEELVLKSFSTPGHVLITKVKVELINNSWE